MNRGELTHVAASRALASADRLMTTGRDARILLFMSVQLNEVMLLGTSDDTELLTRLAHDLLRFDIRASPKPPTEKRPVQIGSSVTSTVLLWTRSAVESRWLVSEVDDFSPLTGEIANPEDLIQPEATPSSTPTTKGPGS